MARILGVDVPNNKRSEIGLTYLYGIGRRSVYGLLEAAGINPATKIGELSESDISNLRKVMEEKYTVEGDLRSEVGMNVKRLIDIGCYRGLRHRNNLPARGQRTRTNARTRKGPKRTIANKKKATK